MASRKNKKHKYIAYGIVAAIVLVLVAAIAIVLLKPKHDYNYGAYEITKDKCTGTDRDCYYVSLSVRGVPYVMSFYNHPKDVEDVLVTPNAMKTVLDMQRVANHTVYIAIPPNAPGEVGIAGVALARVLGTRYGIMNLNVRAATFGTGPGELSCANATARTVIISLEQTPIDGAAVRAPNCVTLGASNASRIVPVTEAYTYHLFGVIPTYTKSELNSTGNSTNGSLLR